MQRLIHTVYLRQLTLSKERKVWLMGKAKAQNRNSPKNQHKPGKIKGDILLKELKLLVEHYSLSGDKPPLSPSLQALETQSLRDAQKPGQITEEKQVIGRLLDKLRVSIPS